MAKTKEFAMEIDRECANEVKRTTGVDPLAGNEYASLYIIVTQYDDDFGAVPYEKASISVNEIEGENQSGSAIVEAMHRIVTDHDLWELANNDMDLCEYFKERKGGVLC